MHISLAIWFNSAMDIACSWLMLMVLAAVNSAPGAPASGSAGSVGRGRSSDDFGAAASSPAVCASEASSGNPSINPFLFALPLGAFFLATRGIIRKGQVTDPGGHD